MPDLSHCASLVHEHDHDRFLSALFAPSDIREAWFALFAFNFEIATIAESVSEEMLGFIRFAWWREALDEIYAGRAVRKHPVAQALAQAVGSYHLPRAPFDAMIVARQERLGLEPFGDIAQWENYFRVTSSSLLTLCANVAGAEATRALDDLGIAWGCIGTARVTGDIALRRAGEERLRGIGKLPEIFMPFYDTAEFYLKRLKVGRVAGSQLRLPLVLCWRRLIRQVTFR